METSWRDIFGTAFLLFLLVASILGTCEWLREEYQKQLWRSNSTIFALVKTLTRALGVSFLLVVAVILFCVIVIYVVRLFLWLNKPEVSLMLNTLAGWILLKIFNFISFLERVLP